MAKKTRTTKAARAAVTTRGEKKASARKTSAKVKRSSESAARDSRRTKRRPRATVHRPLRHICDVHVFGAPPRTADRSIDDLKLQAYVKTAAEQLLTAHPSVKFTSGRRTVKEQADAMAGNVVVNRKYIEQTYATSAERDALQKWVDDNPQATTKAAISTGLEGVMNGWNDAQKRKLSLHFSGEAFDVNPVGGSTGDQIKVTIKNLPKLRKFLESEGGLTIWHAEFSP